MANKRKDLTLAEKVNLLDRIKDYKPRPSTRQLAVILGVPKTTLVNLLQREIQLRIELQQSKTSVKRKRHGKNPEIEKALKTWFQIVVERGVKMTGPLLKEKAETFARELNYTGFKATDGWLSRWKVREGIEFKRSQGQKAGSDRELTKNWILIEVPNLQDEYSSANIYKENELDLVKHIVENIKQERNDKNKKNETELIKETSIEKISHEEAKKCIEKLKQYFMQKGNETCPWSEFHVCYDFVMSKITKNNPIL